MIYLREDPMGDVMKTVLVPLAEGLCPLPSAFLTFRSTSGAAELVPAAWVGVVCSRPAILSITLKGASCHPSLPQGGEFAVNLPSEDQLTSPFYKGLLAGGREKWGGVGEMNFVPGAGIAAPVIAESPVRIECRGATFFSRFGQKLLSGEVVAVHIEGTTYGLEGPIDFCRLRPLARPLSEARKAGFEGIIPQGLESATLGLNPH